MVWCVVIFLQRSFVCVDVGVGKFLGGMCRGVLLLCGRGVSCCLRLPCAGGERCFAVAVADFDELFCLVLCAFAVLFSFSVVGAALFSCAIGGCWRFGESLALSDAFECGASVNLNAICGRVLCMFAALSLSVSAMNCFMADCGLEGDVPSVCGCSSCVAMCLPAGMFAALSLSDAARNCSKTPLGMFVSSCC